MTVGTQITKELVDNETCPPLKKIYERLLEFKNQHSLESITLTEIRSGLIYNYEVVPSLPEEVLDVISDEIDDMYSDVSRYVYNENEIIKYGYYCGFVNNK